MTVIQLISDGVTHPLKIMLNFINFSKQLYSKILQKYELFLFETKKIRHFFCLRQITKFSS